MNRSSSRATKLQAGQPGVRIHSLDRAVARSWWRCLLLSRTYTCASAIQWYSPFSLCSVLLCYKRNHKSI